MIVIKNPDRFTTHDIEFIFNYQSSRKFYYQLNIYFVIHSASPQSRPAVIVAWFWSFGTDGRTDATYRRTDTLCEHSDHFRPGLWSASWINSSLFNCIAWMMLVYLPERSFSFLARNYSRTSETDRCQRMKISLSGLWHTPEGLMLEREP